MEPGMDETKSVIKDLVARCGALTVYEKREVREDYCELVFMNEDLDKWETALTEIFGTAAKPPKARPTKEDRRLTEAYGGIQKDQTLFKKEFDGFTSIAMLWPWQDDIHTTLKAALIKK